VQKGTAVIHNAILEAYRCFEEHSWNKIYVALDIHGTVAQSDYKTVRTQLYDTCVPALREISSYKEVSIILFSCCHPHDYLSYMDLFRKNAIAVSYFNTNPEVPNTETGCFDSKFYYNVIFEDKAGFRPYMWPQVLTTFRQARQFNKRIQELKEKVW
jgi:hypothetical protein